MVQAKSQPHQSQERRIIPGNYTDVRKKRITHKNTNTKEEEKAKSAKTEDIIGSLPLFWSILAHHKVFHSKLI